MSFPVNGDINSIASKYVNDKVLSVDKAIEGAGYIIAEWISDNAYYRKWIRSYTYKNGLIVTKVKKDNPDTSKVYEMYYDFKDRIKTIKNYRVLAINRGEKEKVLSVKLSYDKEFAYYVAPEDIENQIKDKITGSDYDHIFVVIRLRR